MRRKEGGLVPFERNILEVACRLRNEGLREFYASQASFRFQLAQKQADGTARYIVPFELTENGTLYRALKRLEKMGYLKSHWERLRADMNRPRRRYYRLTDLGLGLVG